MKFVGTVRNGRIERDLPSKYSDYLRSMDGKRIVEDVNKFYKKRSLEQNSYWWAVVIPALAEHFGYEQTKEDYESVHSGIMTKFFPIDLGHGIVTYKSSTKLTTIEFNDLIERVQRWAATELGVYIPDPNEYI